MKNYLFWLTVRVDHRGKPMDARVMRGCRAENEHEARRNVLRQMLEGGFQVKKIDPDDQLSYD